MKPQNIRGILLAAGLSTRMESNNKLLLPYKGKTIIEHTVGNLLKANLAEVIVVTGHQNEKMNILLSSYDVNIVVNEDYGSGQVSSVKKGLKALGNNTDSFMIALSDMPSITTDQYNELISQFLTYNTVQSCILRPRLNYQIPGNPVLFDETFKQKLLNNTDSLSSKNVLINNKDSLKYFDTSFKSFFRDIDILADYEKLISSG